MAALLADRYGESIESTGWQDMRQQLFGQQRQREAETRLLRVIGEIHARLAAASRGGSAARLSPKARAKVLGAAIEGANQLMCWHRDELLAGRTAGRWTSPLPETAQGILAEVQAVSSLFGDARVTGRTIDGADVVQGIACLTGADGDAFFNDALNGAEMMLRAAFERIATDGPTAHATMSLGETWETLLADVRSLTIPLPERVVEEPAHDVVAEVADEIAPAPVLLPQTFAIAEPKAGADAPAPLMLTVPSTEMPMQSPVAAPMDAPAPVILDAERWRNLVHLAPILAARFSRINLVAC